MVEKVKIFQWKFVRLVQRILIAISLFLIYFFGFGLTKVFAVIFNRRLLGKSKKADTFWLEAKGYLISIKDALRES